MKFIMMFIAFSLICVNTFCERHKQSSFNFQDRYHWPAWSELERMDYIRLRIEITLLRKDLIILQSPLHLEDKEWTEGCNRWNVMQDLLCKELKYQTCKNEPIPQPDSLRVIPAEDELVGYIAKAILGSRPNAALYYASLGAEAGYIKAQYLFGYLLSLSDDPKKRSMALQWLRKASFGGSTEARDLLRKLEQ